MLGTEHRREVQFPPDRDSDGAHLIFPVAVAQSLSRMRSAQAPYPKDKSRSHGEARQGGRSLVRLSSLDHCIHCFKKHATLICDVNFRHASLLQKQQGYQNQEE